MFINYAYLRVIWVFVIIAAACMMMLFWSRRRLAITDIFVRSRIAAHHAQEQQRFIRQLNHLSVRKMLIVNAVMMDLIV